MILPSSGQVANNLNVIPNQGFLPAAGSPISPNLSLPSASFTGNQPLELQQVVRRTPSPAPMIPAGVQRASYSPVALPIASAALVANSPAPPTQEELIALGFHPVESITVVGENGQVENFVMAFNKNAYKVIILIDVPMNVNLRQVQMKMVQPVVNEIPESHQNVCKSCCTDMSCGVMYKRQDNICRLRVAEGKPVADWYSQSNGISDPRGMFRDDITPFPIFRLSDIRAKVEAIHCAIATAANLALTTLSNSTMCDLNATIAESARLTHNLDVARQIYYAKYMEISNHLAKLRAIDQQYENINMCDNNMCEAAANDIINRRGQLWDNIAHRQIMLGSLVGAIANITRLKALLCASNLAVEESLKAITHAYKECSAIVKIPYTQE